MLIGFVVARARRQWPLKCEAPQSWPGPIQHADIRACNTPADPADAGLADLVAQQVAAAQLRRRRQVQPPHCRWGPSRVMQAGEGAAAISCIGGWLSSCSIPRSCCAEGCGSKRPGCISASACRANALAITEPIQCGAEGSSKACGGPELPTCQHHKRSVVRLTCNAHALRLLMQRVNLQYELTCRHSHASCCQPHVHHLKVQMQVYSHPARRTALRFASAIAKIAGDPGRAIERRKLCWLPSCTASCPRRLRSQP